MRNIKVLRVFLVVLGVVLGSFLVFSPQAKAFSCSLSFSSTHGSQIYVGDRVTWSLTSDFSGGKSYWFGTKNGATDVSAMNTGMSNPFTWTTDPYPSDTVGNYTRWVQINDINGNFLCQTPLVYVSVVNPPAPTPTASLSVTPSTVTAGQSLTYSWFSTDAASWAWTLNIFKTSDLSHTVSTDGCGNSTSNWSGPSGGNSAQDSWTGATAICQAGYTYQITYKAINSSGTTPSQSAIVTVTAATVTPTPAASLILTATGSVYPIFSVGDTFTLQLTSNQYSQPFYLCFTLTGNPSGYNHTNRCTATTLTTNSNGGYTFYFGLQSGWSGTWDSTNIGTWTEWVKFGSYESPRITFTISADTRPAALLKFTATESINPIFRVGNGFTLNLTSNQYSQPFYLCSNLTGNPSGYNHTNRCTATTMTTNSSGGYTCGMEHGTTQISAHGRSGLCSPIRSGVMIRQQ